MPSTILIGKYKFKVVSIADNAFKNDTTLTSITLGSNVGKIGKNAFYKCNKLKTIMINSKKLKTVGSSAVKGIKSTATIIIPNGKLIPYQKLFTKTTGYNSRTMKMKTK